MSYDASPKYRHRQSNKTLDPTGQTAKFLYTILKQLDLKNVDWNEVADSLGITNGHAARMRWSRFRAQIEGLDNSYSRRSEKKDRGRGEKRKRGKEAKDDRPTEEADVHEDVQQKRRRGNTGREGVAGGIVSYDGLFRGFKDESAERISVLNGVNIHHPTVTTIANPSVEMQHQYFPAQFRRGQHVSPMSNVGQSRIGTSGLPLGQQRWPPPSLIAGRPYTAYRGNAMSSYNDPGARYTSQPASAFRQGTRQNNNGQTSSSQPQYIYSRFGPSSANISDINTFISNSTETTEQVPLQVDHTAHVNAQPVSRVEDVRPVAETVTSTTQPAVNTQEQVLARALAAQDSYPWPYSEETVPQFVDQATEVVRLASLTPVDAVNVKEEPKSVSVNEAVVEHITIKDEPESNEGV